MANKKFFWISTVLRMFLISVMAGLFLLLISLVRSAIEIGKQAVGPISIRFEFKSIDFLILTLFLIIFYIYIMAKDSWEDIPSSKKQWEKAIEVAREKHSLITEDAARLIAIKISKDYIEDQKSIERYQIDLKAFQIIQTWKELFGETKEIEEG